ncbi:MAG: hypoxanthine phosphoribosyltransferase [Bacteroidales bacterium]|nr:hypoxanthine phosphoribosyltransferase [Bacteroidales bacterium]
MKEEVTILDKTFVKYILDEDINAAVAHVAAQINHDYAEEPPLILITLNGAIVFAVDLLKHLDINARITCVKISSYQGIESTQKINQLIGLNDDVRGKRVLIVEDIVDTGRTYQYLWDMLHEAGAKDVRIATMTLKPEAYKLDLPVHYVGFSIPNKFVIGRGLDYDGYGRQLPDIYQLKMV